MGLLVIRRCCWVWIFSYCSDFFFLLNVHRAYFPPANTVQCYLNFTCAIWSAQSKIVLPLQFIFFSLEKPASVCKFYFVQFQGWCKGACCYDAVMSAVCPPPSASVRCAMNAVLVRKCGKLHYVPNFAVMWAAGTLFKRSGFADVIAPAVHLDVSPELTLSCICFLRDSSKAKLSLHTAAHSMHVKTKALDVPNNIKIKLLSLSFTLNMGAGHWLKREAKKSKANVFMCPCK